ncbi:hypothetical protein FRACYDRAFT_235572 [Fragilariopsis cylindrus CCMP1102]|uniref:1-alkyl-2-acetylglycerophosphocholine esterase n=1 Tax=Fragilariopsis cylindrus CCMP1102 TaxID=635003 RepID=A0A1E7FN47_9STRA|nr:hypothetical protein FRACYDRAFT_235572 [Fragilariopsis cylindrus CCMP1102]|eukprot:OEU19515.1 hypothetical protein FRACYDRAFT_235572 [Fragilariopsis cylindrus CCMP1102]
MRLLSSVTKKALLAFGYPRLNIDPTTIDNDNLSNNNNSKNTASSLYNVGATKIRMSTDLPACQLFYPADDDLKKKKNENSQKFIPYFRKEAVTGMIDYLNGFGDGVLQMLEEKSHPCQQYYDCNPITMTTMNRNNENNDNDESNNTINKFPLLLFSHGLGGNMELYTELCAMIASYGYIVVAIEHEDGSASYAASSASSASFDDDEKKVKEQEKQIPYQQPFSNAKVPYSRQKVLDMRTPMLEQRVNELQQIYNYMATTTTNENDVPVPSSSELVQKIISITNLDELHLVGHSFGGATQLLAAQQWMTSKAVKERTETERIKSSSATTIIGTADSSGDGGIATAVVAAPAPATTTTIVTTNTISNTATTKIPPIPKSIMVLDAWCYALSDEILNNGISISISVVDDDDDDDDEQQAQQQYPKIISILSQDWALTNQERKQTLQFLKNCNNNNVSSYYAKDSVHQSFSDTECWLPTYIARKTFGMRGMKEDRHITIRSCVQEFIKQTQTSTQEQTTGTQQNNDDNNNNNDNNILIPFPYK